MIGILLTSIAVFLRVISNPLGNVFQKQLTADGQHPVFVNHFTYLALALLCILIATGTNWLHLPFQFWFYSTLAGIVGALGNGFLVKALQQGDLSVLGPVNAYKSVVSIIIGIFLLGEIPNIWGITGIALIIWGSYFVLDTTSEKFSWKLFKRTEIRYRIWAMILTAIEAVFIKKIILASSTTIAFISWCWFGAFFSFWLAVFYRVNVIEKTKHLSFSDLKKFLFLIICIGTMQFTTNYAFDHMAVGYALSLFQLSIIISILLGYRFFREKEIVKKLIGALIMIAGSIMIILLK